MQRVDQSLRAVRQHRFTLLRVGRFGLHILERVRARYVWRQHLPALRQKRRALLQRQFVQQRHSLRFQRQVHVLRRSFPTVLWPVQ